jgi:hypothetical protein
MVDEQACNFGLQTSLVWAPIDGHTNVGAFSFSNLQ